MRTRTLKIIAPVFAALLAVSACSVEKTDEGKMPDVDVKAEGGDLPNYDVEPAKVEVSTDTQQVVTPDVDIKPATEAAETPEKQ